MEERKLLSWEYELSRGRWVRYENVISEKLNDGISNGVAQFEIDESNLEVAFSTMKQINMDTGFIRSVRCAIRNDEGDYRVWEYIDAKRRWRSVDPISAIKLENAYRDGSEDVKIQLSGADFTADFKSGVIRSDDRLVEYEIRWHISKAEHSLTAKPVPTVHCLRAAKRVAERMVSVAKSKRKAIQKEVKMNGSDDGDGKKNCKSSKYQGRRKTKPEGQTSSELNRIPGNDNESEMGKMVLKSVAAVDSECHELLNFTHVYTEFNDIYDALLNETSAKENNSKYFIIQLLESDAEKRYWVWFRWGRVGCKGRTILNRCGADLVHAKELFCGKFREKTGNEWRERANFERVANKYDYLPADYSKIVSEQKNAKKDVEEKEEALVESKLDSSLQHLLKLICDVRTMEETMMELEYDATKAPLEKVTEEQIKTGYTALKEIEKYIQENDFSSSFMKAVNNYYTKVPHFFGTRQKPLIRTTEQLKAEIKLLEALSEIGMAVRTFKKNGELDIHPIDRHYMNMKCDISVIGASDPHYKVVENYLEWTHTPTHPTYRARIHNVYAISRDGERERFMFDLGNRKLLWHGSRLTNWYSILSQGLRIAPPEAPLTGYMFGKGIYFADMATKSANYCYPQPGKPGFLVLAEVALGKMNELLHADYNADKLPAGMHSTKGLGSIGPDPATYVILEDGCEVPCGKPVTLPAKDKNTAFYYNEYIIYDVKQVWIRYLVEVDFIYD